MEKIDKIDIDVSKLSAVVGGWPRGNHDELQRQLNILGISNVVMTDSFEHVQKAIHTDKSDILLCNVNGARTKAHAVMQGVRQQEIGTNPFLVMMSVVRPKDKSDVEETIDAGPDDLLMSPFRRDVFIDRIKEIGIKRKKFVATSSFIGPTRRTSARPGRKSAEEFDVPNSVRSLGTGVPRDKFWQEVQSAAKSLHSRKMNSDIKMIESLIEEITPDYENSNINDDFKRRIGLLESSISALHERSLKLGYVNVSNLCEMSGNIINDIKERPIPPNLRHLMVMPKLVQGFHSALEIIDTPSQ